MRVILLLSAITLLSAPANSQEASVGGILAIAKMTGICGIMNSQTHFQQTTKMPNGNKFITRFWNMEAARLGMTMQEFLNQCNETIPVYNTLFEASEEIDKQ